MNMKRLNLMLCMVALFGGVACNETSSDDGAERGRLRVQMVTDSVLTDITRAEETQKIIDLSTLTTLPATSQFTLTVRTQADHDSGSQGTPAWQGGVSEVSNEGIALNTGYYYVTASYGNSSEEGFDKPYLMGESSSFYIAGGETTQVSVKAALANAAVRIVTTDLFDSYFSEQAYTIVTGAGTSIAMSRAEKSKVAFIDPYKFTVNATLKNQQGKEQSFSREYTSLSAKNCYTVKLDSNVGGSQITITFDDKIETVDLGDLELNE
jgi:hypothetical protein